MYIFFNPSLGALVVKRRTHRPISLVCPSVDGLTARVWYLSKGRIKLCEIRYWGHVLSISNFVRQTLTAATLHIHRHASLRASWAQTAQRIGARCFRIDVVQNRTEQHTLLIVFYVIKQNENHSVFSHTSQNVGLTLIKCRIGYLRKNVSNYWKLHECRFYRNYRLYTIWRDFQTPIICMIVTPYERRLN